MGVTAICGAPQMLRRSWAPSFLDLARWWPVLLVLGCGPGLESPPSSASSTGPTTSTSTAAEGAAASTLPTSSPPNPSTLDGADATDDVSTLGTTGPTTPPGTNCGRPPPAVEPPVPEGCEALWLVDAEGQAIEGAPSGLVTCTPEDWRRAVYRTGAVACPELIGDECLCDADCGAGEACICANEATTAPGLGQQAGNRCMPADCSSSDDCGGSWCRVDISDCLGAWFPQAFRCTTPADDCQYDTDCSKGGGEFCDYDEQMELFTCESGFICE